MNPCKCKYIGKERSKCIFVTGSLKSGNPKYDFFYLFFNFFHQNVSNGSFYNSFKMLIEGTFT